MSRLPEDVKTVKETGNSETGKSVRDSIRVSTFFQPHSTICI